ncbi:valine--tRNA ligase [Candidatus Woesearchaeota archaeon]|jgi:valyl-tRNA synthetase|nr:valine--tRNA ligase [Candidatus Woesearchaeota archaeon]MBT4111101.1 valine--tRNA ligase [Candidatus Woesearchaeota archaeon]MBT4335745.1 valine--tRNA ligase [Candidatus Woesearchaeota archaeon]MBT4469268.1 valine--tRNA ligase [Candidatus Woesearchaeota archaeon]MBT6744240.1 valine--tRNA ligase [Candidatus Woesearchaeota archaeon]
MELPKRYDPKEAEPRLQQFWEENKTYAFNAEDTERKIFSIDTPPPTVSGKMHMGHAFSNSQQDFIARYKRMQNFNVLQPLGTDDNGLPTMLLIQKLKKVRANMMDRKEFRKLVLDVLENELKPSYINDWKKLGISCDYNVKYSTIDPHAQKISQKSFIDLYKAGREYRTKAPAMHCPKCQTAISQVECEDLEVSSHFNDIIFKAEGEDLTVATTRPELLPACVAVFYHPEDKRYQHLKGKKAKVPLFDLEVPIMEDERADPEKGTGLVMCCTFGDQTDMEWQKAHQLPIREAIGKDGKMTELADKYQDLKILDARKEIIEDLKSNNLLTKQEPITHAVNVHERCGTPIEFINSKQWFIKYLDLKEDMAKWGEEFTWYPKHMKNRYDNWVKGLAWDWCISRQIPYGIPFPVWYCQDCDETILAREEDLPVDPLEDKAPVDACPKCGSKEIIPETDIINTWATSSLTPTIVKELFKGKPVYEQLVNNPEDMRPQAHDIISFWLFNTVVKSQLHFKMAPWKNAFISGWMLDPKGKKMSKSKGNVIEPRAMIEKYSADALRFMSAGCKLGDDFPFQEKDLLTGNKFVNKIWNASKFGIMHLEDYQPYGKVEKLEVFDKWLLSKLHKVIKISAESFDKFEYSKSKSEVEKFFWQIFCDQYLEIVKDRLYNPDVRGSLERTSGQLGVFEAINSVLKMMSPITPHITEEIYRLYFAEKENEKSVHTSTWPKFDSSLIDEQAELAGDLGVDIINAVRKYKSEKQMSLKEELAGLVLVSSEENFEEMINSISEDLKAVLKVKEIKFSGETSLESEKFAVKVGISA